MKSKKVKLVGLLVLIASFYIVSCKKDDSDTFTEGKHRITINIDNVSREFYIHVPKNYTNSISYPVVIMCHGTGGNGLKFYNISGWTDVGDEEGIITVFPSSGEYCINDNGVQENTSKWNAPGSFDFCSGVVPLNDQKFMEQMITWLDNNISIDMKRIHIVGFSNGGSFASYCGFTMTNIFASAVSASGATIGDTTFNVADKIPIILQVGNSDPKFTSTPFPMDLESLFSQDPTVQSIISTYKSSLGLAEMPSYSGNVNQYLQADFLPVNTSENHFFKFILVKDLEHNYPNGTNHPMKGAQEHWNMIKNISKL